MFFLTPLPVSTCEQETKGQDNKTEEECTRKMNDRKRAVRYGISFVILAVLLIFLFIWNVNSGSIHLSVKEILNIIFRHQGDETSYNIVWEIRLPRILAVIILGGALSVSGFLLQTFLTTLSRTLCIGNLFRCQADRGASDDLFLSRSVSIGSGAMILAAFAGSMISMGFVLLVAKKSTTCPCWSSVVL